MDATALQMALVSAAAEAAAASLACPGDGGSANLDSVLLPVGSTHQIQRKAKAITAAITAAGLSWIYVDQTIRGYLIPPPSSGQGARRTAAMKAMVASLESQAVEVFPWYQID